MDINTVESKILALDVGFYFEDLENGEKFLCKDYMDVGLDLKLEGVYLYSEPEELIKYDDELLMDKVKNYLKSLE